MSCAPRSTPATIPTKHAEMPDSAKQTEATNPSPPPDQSDPSPQVESDEPAPILRDPDPIQVLVEKSGARIKRAEHRFQEGRQEEARQYFDHILRDLRESGFPFSEHPRLTKAYYRIVARIQTLDVEALVRTSANFTPKTEEGFLDEITRRNIFAIEVDPELGEIVTEELELGRFDMPMIINKRVVRFLEYYMGPGRHITEQGLKRSGKYLSYFREVFNQEGVPLDLIYLPHVESLFKVTAYSRAHAAGIWQFIAGTARTYDLEVGWWVDERHNVELSTVAAARHLRDLYDEFGDWYLALAAYNAGPGRVRRNLKRFGKIDYWTMVERKLLPRESRNYVPAILASILIYKHPTTYGFSVQTDEPLQFETIAISHQFDLRVIAEMIGVESATLAELNPELRRRITPHTDQPYQLRVPPGKAELAARRIAEIPPEKRLRVRHHRVQKGDTLWHLARGYRTSIDAIVHINRIHNPNRLRLGQLLIIPLKPHRGGAQTLSRTPSDPFYTVRSGDSLYKIARRFRLPVKRLVALNKLTRQEVIYPGQRLRLR